MNSKRIDVWDVNSRTLDVISSHAKDLNVSRNQLINIILDGAARDYSESEASKILRNRDDDIIVTLNTLINRSNENEQEIMKAIKGYAEIERDKLFELSALLTRVETILSRDQNSKYLAKEFTNEDEKAF